MHLFRASYILSIHQLPGIRTLRTRTPALAFRWKRRGAFRFRGIRGRSECQRRKVQAALWESAPRAATAKSSAAETARGRPRTTGHRQETAREEGKDLILQKQAIGRRSISNFYRAHLVTQSTCEEKKYLGLLYIGSNFQSRAEQLIDVFRLRK